MPGSVPGTIASSRRGGGSAFRDAGIVRPGPGTAAAARLHAGAVWAVPGPFVGGARFLCRRCEAPLSAVPNPSVDVAGSLSQQARGDSAASSPAPPQAIRAADGAASYSFQCAEIHAAGRVLRQFPLLRPTSASGGFITP